MSLLPPPRSAGRGGSEEVFTRLVQGISTGQLRGGDRLPSEDQLAAQLDVAPMTLRQALAQLRELGYVETRRGRHGGTYVQEDIADRLESSSRNSPVPIAALRELTDWRRAVSGEAAYLAALRATPEELEQLLRFSDEYHHVYLRPADRRLADARFHVYVAELARNDRLVEAERDIQDTLSRILRIIPDEGGDRTYPSASHKGLVEAIMSGDAETARRELHEHIENTYRWGVQQPNVVGLETDVPPSPAADA